MLFTMCGRYNVTDSPEVQELCRLLGIHLYPEPRLNISPGALGQFIAQKGGERQLYTGMWSMLVEPKPDGSGAFRPNPKFKTFNARSDRLGSSSLWRRLYPSKRAIVPASAFHEWAGKQPYNITQPGRAIAFGALYELWKYGDVVVPAFSIITLPPHPKFLHVHDKSLPLMLEPAAFDMWLDPDMRNTEALADLLESRLRQDLLLTPIDSPKTLATIGEPELFPAD
ncbi:DUF159 family protein [Chitinimonas prasina]|uniref:Abasic site processing protein n=1 Tax=Chitinimonas prasina TaxID=1434937 RepID=A0ABQ5YJW7_9NEIS|nr:SOS response-associated peptidase family protein [Chitinimonas prasina]GLR13244.1 DUF159 family protein [Chitinimonas prasina]